MCYCVIFSLCCICATVEVDCDGQLELAARSCLFVSEEVLGKPRAATKEIPDNKTLTLLQFLHLDFSLYRNSPIHQQDVEFL